MTTLPSRHNPIAAFAPWRQIGVESLSAAVTGILATALAWIAFRLTPETFTQRWGTGGPDQVLHYMIFRSAEDVFPFGPNTALGFPNAQNLFFAPLFDPWSAIFVAVLGLFTNDSIVILNTYLLLTFFGTAFTAVLFFRLLGINRPLAVTFSVAFAVLPLHFMQLALGHPFLANYWAVPLIGVLLLIVGGATNPFEGWIEAATSARMRAARRWIPIATLALLVGLTQSYYLVFAAIMVGGLWLFRLLRQLILREGIRTMLWPSVTLGTLGAVIGLQLAVLSLNFNDRYEKYFSARTAGESELYGGKIAALVLPWPQTGVPKLGEISQKYFSLAPVVPTSEGPWTSLLVAVGIVFVVLALFVTMLSSGAQRTRTTRLGAIIGDQRFSLMSVAFLWSLFFYVTGGLGVIFAVVLSPEIRAWSRISVILSLAVLAMMALALQQLARTSRAQWVAIFLIAVVILVDQVGGGYKSVPLSPKPDTELKALVADMESTLNPGCGVVQLPLKAFPESGNVGLMGDYDEGLPYLYSTQLRWSYGAVRGTLAGDYWDSLRGSTPISSAIVNSGACAVLVNMTAYVDEPGAWKLIVDKVADSSQPSIVSSEGNYEMFTVR